MGKMYIDMIVVANLLKGGYTTTEVADNLLVSYGTLCKRLSSHHLTNKGILKEDKLTYTATFKEFLTKLSNHFTNIQEIADFLGVTRERVSSIYSSAKVYVTWSLENNHNDLLASSRRAELFVKNLGYRVVRDCYTCKSASHQKAAYDLILEGFGSVDVKSTPIKKDKYGNTYAAFNTQNFTKGVKYAFCVALDSNREDFIAVFAIPGKLVYGHSTIHITLDPLSKKYSEFLIWKSEAYSL